MLLGLSLLEKDVVRGCYKANAFDRPLINFRYKRSLKLLFHGYVNPGNRVSLMV